MMRAVAATRLSVSEMRSHRRNVADFAGISAGLRLLIEGGFKPTLDSTPDKFRQSLAADVALWAPIVKSLGLKID